MGGAREEGPPGGATGATGAGTAAARRAVRVPRRRTGRVHESDAPGAGDVPLAERAISGAPERDRDRRGVRDLPRVSWFGTGSSAAGAAGDRLRRPVRVHAADSRARGRGGGPRGPV